MKLIQLLESLDIKADKDLLEKLKRFRLDWITRDKKDSAEHIDFLSTDLVGVYPVLFSKTDVETIYDILNVEGKSFKKDVKKLSDINPEFKNITEPVYILMLYVMYLFNIGKASKAVKEEARNITMSILLFKMVSSILNHYYREYNVSINDASLTRERMHGNNLFVRYGSWNNVIKHFAEAVTDEKGLHGKRLRKNFKVDDITYIISNTKTSINSFVFNSNLVYLNVKEGDSTHSTTKAFLEGDDAAILQDHKNIHLDLTRAYRLILATGDFYNNDVVEVLFSTYVGLKKDDLINGIKVIEELFVSDESKELLAILDLLFETTIHTLYIDKLHPPYSRNIVKIIEYLKNYYTSSRVSDKRLIEVKDYLKKHMKTKLKRNSRRSVAIANTVMVYCFILTNIELRSYNQ